jgi:hypothetical protein
MWTYQRRCFRQSRSDISPLSAWLLWWNGHRCRRLWQPYAAIPRSNRIYTSNGDSTVCRLIMESSGLGIVFLVASLFTALFKFSGGSLLFQTFRSARLFIVRAIRLYQYLSTHRWSKYYQLHFDCILLSIWFVQLLPSCWFRFLLESTQYVKYGKIALDVRCSFDGSRAGRLFGSISVGVDIG